jgi:hypothetical protein
LYCAQADPPAVAPMILRICAGFCDSMYISNPYSKTHPLRSLRVCLALPSCSSYLFHSSFSFSPCPELTRMLLLRLYLLFLVLLRLYLIILLFLLLLLFLPIHRLFALIAFAYYYYKGIQLAGFDAPLVYDTHTCTHEYTSKPVRTRVSITAPMKMHMKSMRACLCGCVRAWVGVCVCICVCWMCGCGCGCTAARVLSVVQVDDLPALAGP